MVEAAQIIACFAAVLLAAGLAGWVKMFRDPALRRIDGGLKEQSRLAEFSSQMLMFAVGLSAIAAILAVLGLFAG